MARVLIVGCGCRGQRLAAALVARGHAVRGTTRDTARWPAIAAAGAEPVLADPDRIGTLMEPLAGVTVVCWLMGTATGDAARVAQLYGGRLSMLFERLVDTPVRGLVHEAAGALDPALHAVAREIVATGHATWRIPVAAIDVDPADHERWLVAGTNAVESLLTPGDGAR